MVIKIIKQIEANQIWENAIKKYSRSKIYNLNNFFKNQVSSFKLKFKLDSRSFLQSRKYTYSLWKIKIQKNTHTHTHIMFTLKPFFFLSHFKAHPIDHGHFPVPLKKWSRQNVFFYHKMKICLKHFE